MPHDKEIPTSPLGDTLYLDDSVTDEERRQAMMDAILNQSESHSDDSTPHEDEIFAYKTRSSRHHQPPKKPKDKNSLKVTGKRILKYSGYVLLVLALCFTAFAGYTLRQANLLADNSYKARSTSTKKDNVTVPKKPISILVMGIDNTSERQLDSTRTDALIVCTYNPKNGKTEMISIPRDTYMHLEGSDYDTYEKINSAYSLGQEEGTIKAVQKLLNIPIDYYVCVDFNCVEDVVNAFDGIYVDVPFTLKEQNANGKKKVQLTEGKNQKLDGEQALAFARTRHIDNDIERGKRQQQVIEAIIQRATEVGSITKYNKVLQSLNGHIQTDMPKSVILGLAKNATNEKPSIQHYTFEWAPFQYNGESFVALNQESLSFVQHRLRVSLGLDEKDERDEKDYTLPATTQMAPSTYPAYGTVLWQ